MKTFLAIGCAIGAVLGASAIRDFDDNQRRLERVDDLTNALPFSTEEVGRMRSLLEKKHIQVLDDRKVETLLEREDLNSHIARSLSQNRASKPKSRTARNPRPQKKATRNSPTKETRHSPRSEPKPRTENHSRPHPTTTERHHPSDDFVVAYDDDDDNHDVFYGGGSGIEYVLIYASGFQDGRNLAAAIPPNVDLPDEFDAGATYIFDEENVHAVETTLAFNDTITVIESEIFATVTGKCIRTDPSDELDGEYLGRAYCHFVYMFDGFDEFVAEGVVMIGESATLSVTGGLGIYRRTVGEVVLTVVDTDNFPEVIPSFGDIPTSYFMEAFLWMDQFLLPEEILE